jgi:hypothetical protein
MTTLSCPKKSQAVYRPRRPEKTPLFQVIKKHYHTWHKKRENLENPVPDYVDSVFKKYLGCGILAKGFACAHCEDCHKDFFLAFSCKGRGICPSCNTRAMAQTAAHLIDSVLPRISFRQFVISFPMRIRHYLQTHKILQAVLKIVVDEIRKRLIACSPNIANPQIGAISFIQYFGNALNYHPHFHLIVADGIFNGETGTEALQFHEASLTQDDIADTQEYIQKRVLGLFLKRGLFNKEEVEKMLSYENSGFSLDAKVKIEASDKDGLERLIRYCARPPFKSENIRLNGPWINYHLPKPSRDGKTFIVIDAHDFLDRISRFVPYPRRHRHHFHGIFAANSPQRKQVAANAQKRLETEAKAREETIEKTKKVSQTWAKLIARIYEVNPLVCEGCGKEIKIIGFVTHSSQIWRILKGIGWPVDVPEFDSPNESLSCDICQLIPNTRDGFPEVEEQVHYDTGPDPPHCDEYCDSPHWED